MKYLVFYKKDKPFIAIPVMGGIKIAFIAAGCLPSHTLIRKIFKVYMYLRIMVFFVFPLDSNEINGVLKEWLTDQQTKVKNLYPVFIWSLVDGRERYYVHLMDEDGNKKYFVKITTKAQDYILLENEKNKLKIFSNAKNFSVPTILAFVKNDVYCSLTTSYIDSGYRLYHPDTNIFPEEVSKEISKNICTVNINKIIGEIDVQPGVNINDFINFISSFDKDFLVKTSRVHGDFGSENIFNNKRFFIIDWEISSDEAPYLTDKIAFWLGKKHKSIKKNNLSVYNEFMGYFKQEDNLDLALGLLFLINAKFDLAVCIAEQWNEKNE